MKHDGAINIVEYPIRNMCWVHDVTGKVLRNVVVYTIPHELFPLYQ